MSCVHIRGQGRRRAMTNLLCVGIVAVGAHQERAVIARVARVAQTTKDFERVPCEGIVGHSAVTDSAGARGNYAVDSGELGQGVHVQALPVEVAGPRCACARQAVTRRTRVSSITHARARGSITIACVAALDLLRHVRQVVCRRVGEPRHVGGAQAVRTVGPCPTRVTVASVRRTAGALSVTRAGHSAGALLNRLGGVAAISADSRCSVAVGRVVIGAARAKSRGGVTQASATALNVLFGADLDDGHGKRHGLNCTGK